MSYPPAAQMIAVLVTAADELTGAEHARELADCARGRFAQEKPAVIGPSSASVGKINDVYRFVFYVKHRDYAALVAVKDALEQLVNGKQWNSDSVQFDFNPMRSY